MQCFDRAFLAQVARLYGAKAVWGPYADPHKPRLMITLKWMQDGTKQTSMGMGKAVRSVADNCRIPEGMVVEHLDGNAFNFDLANLKIVPMRSRGDKKIACRCPGCGDLMMVKQSKLNAYKARGHVAHCGRKCANDSRVKKPVRVAPAQ